MVSDKRALKKKVGKKSKVAKKIKTASKARRAARSSNGSSHRYPINGVGAVSGAPFGASSACRILQGLDATVPRHLTLPINVGPYTVVRTSTVVPFNQTTTGFGVFRGDRLDVQSTEGPVPLTTLKKESGWLPICGFGGNGTASPTSSNTSFFGIPQLSELGKTASAVPAAVTVQIMNPGALATAATAGILYIGAAKTQFRLQGASRTWDAIGQDFVSYQSPRLCAASKLALRGVQVSAKPANIQELMDFDRVIPSLDTSTSPVTETYEYFTDSWITESTNPSNKETLQVRSLKGFAPIMVYNPANVELQALVTIEWRVRFDSGHPAASTHQVHAASSTQKWDAVQRVSDAIGHGCNDIVEHVAAVGSQHLTNYATSALESMLS
jgi:hypothetical protein